MDCKLLVSGLGFRNSGSDVSCSGYGDASNGRCLVYERSQGTGFMKILWYGLRKSLASQQEGTIVYSMSRLRDRYCTSPSPSLPISFSLSLSPSLSLSLSLPCSLALSFVHFLGPNGPVKDALRAGVIVVGYFGVVGRKLEVALFLPSFLPSFLCAQVWFADTCRRHPPPFLDYEGSLSLSPSLLPLLGLGGIRGLSLSLSLSPAVSLSLNLSGSPALSLSGSLALYLSIYLSIYLSLSRALSLSLSLSLSI